MDVCTAVKDKVILPYTLLSSSLLLLAIEISHSPFIRHTYAAFCLIVLNTPAVTTGYSYKELFCPLWGTTPLKEGHLLVM